MFGRSGSSTESSQSGYDMTGKLELVTMSLLQLQVVHTHHKSCWRLVPPNSGTKHRGLKPGQRKELMAAAKDSAQKGIKEAQQGIKKAVEK